MDSSSTAGGATLKVYPLANVDSSAVRRALQNLFERETPEVQVSVEPYSNNLLAVALPRQHEMISQAISQMHTEERQMEVFQLEVIDPITARLSVENLFADEPTLPLVDVDPNTQRMIVRANSEQLLRIRDLLAKMGETQLGAAQGSRTMRTIPIRGDATDAPREIQRIWPQLRQNELRVVAPRDLVQPTTLPAPSQSPMPAENESSPASPSAPPPGDSTASPPAAPPAAPPEGATSGTAVAAVLCRRRRGADEVTPSSPSDVPSAPADQDAPAPPAGEAPAVIVIPGEGKLTIASNDPEVLQQLESLLRTFMGARRWAPRATSACTVCAMQAPRRLPKR